MNQRIAIEGRSDLFETAKRVSLFRKECKDHLAGLGIVRDKFTAVDHDTFIAEITETVLAEYLRKEHKVRVDRWEDDFNLDRIHRIISEKARDRESVNYLSYFFYDRWDLRIRLDGKVLFADVKTALTTKAVKPNWKFLIPKVQVERSGKDLFILAYLIGTVEKPEAIEVIGACSPSVVRKQELIGSGSQTEHGTTSRISNYTTTIGVDYSPLSSYLRS